MNWLYTLIMLLSMVTCSLALRRYQQALHIPAWQKVWHLCRCIRGAMIGAKLPFALSDWEGLRSGTVWFAHGKTILCGIVGGYFGVEYAKWTMGVTVKTGDTFAVPVAVGVAIGRIACFFGGCCYGVPTAMPWGVVFPNVDSTHRHPTQLYEFSFHFFMACLLFQFQRLGRFRGQLVKLYILAYLSYRFLTEFVRPEPRYFVGLTAYQIASLGLIPVFVWLWFRDSKRFRKLGFN